MSNFAITYKVIIRNEGGWNAPFGASGETYKGIDRKFFPGWDGWPLVDAAKPLHNEAIINNEELEQKVMNFYFSYFSEIVNPENIANQTLADFTADFIFHKRYDAVKVINATALRLQPNIATSNTNVTDGVVTLMNWNAQAFYQLFYNNRIAYYQNPRQFGSSYKGFSTKILTAFIDRVKAFPAAIIP